MGRSIPVVTIAAVNLVASQGNWQPSVAERVLRMAHMLADIARHPALRDAIALKGGTALNLFEWDLPRLSVDLDFNYIASTTRAQMQRDRAVIEEAIFAVATGQSMTAKRIKDEHALSKTRLSYTSISGQPGNVDVEINYLLRSPIEPLQRRATTIGSLNLREILLMSSSEIAAGKIIALLDRTAARDVYDTARLSNANPSVLLTPEFRTCFIAYLAAAKAPWRNLITLSLKLDENEVNRMLIPMLGTHEVTVPHDQFAREILTSTECAIAPLRTVTQTEADFLDAVANDGVVDPALLGINPNDPRFKAISNSPALQWKALNVRQHNERAE